MERMNCRQPVIPIQCPVRGQIRLWGECMTCKPPVEPGAESPGEFSGSLNTRRILGTGVNRAGWNLAFNRLTDEEVLFCLERETRKSSFTRLKDLAMRRGLISGAWKSPIIAVSAR